MTHLKTFAILTLGAAIAAALGGCTSVTVNPDTGQVDFLDFGRDRKDVQISATRLPDGSLSVDWKAGASTTPLDKSLSIIERLLAAPVAP